MRPRRGPAIPHPGAVGASLVALALTGLLSLLVPAVAAYDEADAGLLRADVLEVRHEPQVVPPHTQWNATLVLRPGHHVTGVQYQVCRVGQACFAPPAPARRIDADTFRFDTASYLAGGRPVDYQAGWRIGVLWLLTEQGGANGSAPRTVAFPEGPAPSDPACGGDAQALACQERHYLAFDMPAASRPSPGVAPLAPAPVLLAMAVARTAWRARRGSRDG